MNKFRNIGNGHNENNEDSIINRRNNMKKVIATIVASGFAVAAVVGVGMWVQTGNTSEASDRSVVSANFSPDLPELESKIVVREYVGTSPDLPGIDGKFGINRSYVGTSPDLPELEDAKVRVAGNYAGTSPDLPEIDGSGSTKLEIVRATFAGTSPDLPEIDGGVSNLR